jgi:hypothetical protein
LWGTANNITHYFHYTPPERAIFLSYTIKKWRHIKFYR